MYTGRLLEQWITTVECGERAQMTRESTELERQYLAESNAVATRYDQNLGGVA